jgi:hypothetical protein
LIRLALSLALLPGLAAAQEMRERPLPRDVLPGIGTQDPRRPVDRRHRPGARWGACRRSSAGAARA